ncbi:Imm52 family immunity protein [Paracoccus sp. DMF-8]|uniref:Imm52 family immunity protein n=1 Tax=Paracoccus sp. DMF-8 TaxID=3019445 RepID=UPI0023E7EDBC|nr:Imm52 family immunity protein [Paracoccus sp. DMF-8]MDF3606771.1 Imm52 family immunity protein [Paracoccus sp. DMF-8]
MTQRLDLTLVAKFPQLQTNFDTEADSFLDLLARMRKIPAFNVEWTAQWNEHERPISLQARKDEFLEKFREANRNMEGMNQIWVNEASERLYDFDYTWWDSDSGVQQPTMLSGEIYKSRPAIKIDAQSGADLLDIITRWRRPHHIRFGPMHYYMDQHPLDRSREGIGWMGWVPFSLAPAEVPEAEIVQPMNGGTLIVPQSTLWQAVEGHPSYSKEGIERAQEVEIRLNILGVIPTSMDLDRGGWGQ